VLAGIAAESESAEDPDRTFFVGRLQFSNNAGRDCGDVGRSMAQIVAQVSTIPVRNERHMTLKGREIFETPFLFMNGHNDFVLSEEELRNLRTYLEHGGFSSPPVAARIPRSPRLAARVRPRIRGRKAAAVGLRPSPVPAFYRIDRVRSLDRNVDVHVEGLFWKERLVAVMCEDACAAPLPWTTAATSVAGSAPPTAASWP